MRATRGAPEAGKIRNRNRNLSSRRVFMCARRHFPDNSFVVDLAPCSLTSHTRTAMNCRARAAKLLLSALMLGSAYCFAPPLTTPAKTRLLDAITTGASDAEIAQLVATVEKLNPAFIAGTTASELLPGNWLMVYTTSNTIAGKNRPKLLQVKKPPEQSIDVINGRAQNSESIFGITNAVDITLQPATRNRVDVQFETFRLGPIAFPAPKVLTGSLTTTFLDEELRISRGDKDNLFVLLREANMRDTANAVWDGWRQTW